MPQTPSELTPHVSGLHYFGARLRRLRTERGLSQEQLGRLVHVSGDLIGKIEKAARWPTRELTRRMDQVLDARDELVGLWPQVQRYRERLRTDRARPTGRAWMARPEPLHVRDGVIGGSPERPVGPEPEDSVDDDPDHHPREDPMQRRQVVGALAGLAAGPVGGHDLASWLTSAGQVTPSTGALDSTDAVTAAFHAIAAADPEYPSSLADPLPMTALEARVVQIRRLRVACRYDSALRLIPHTVGHLHTMLDGRQWRKAARLLVLAVEAAASIVRYLGHAQGSALIAERMRQLACRVEDPILFSLAAFQRSHAFSACGATDYARTVAASAVETTRPYADRNGGQQLLGMLMLTASVTCAASRRAGDALAYLNEAKTVAGRIGDSDVLSLHFGPTNIRIWELSMEVDKGDPARAVATATRQGPVRIGQVQRQATYHTDMGRALWHVGRDDEALRQLMDAERLAPAHVRADTRVRRTVRNIIERRLDIPADVKAFSQRIEVM